MSIIQVLGWFSALCLSVSAVPQAFKSIKDKHSNGLAGGNILFWGLGEYTGLCYVFYLGDKPLMLMYLANAVSLGIIIFYWIKGKRRAK